MWTRTHMLAAATALAIRERMCIHWTLVTRGLQWSTVTEEKRREAGTDELIVLRLWLVVTGGLLFFLLEKEIFFTQPLCSTGCIKPS